MNIENRIIGNALLRGLWLSESYENQKLLIENLRQQIANQDSLLIFDRKLITDLSTQLAIKEIVYKNDWAVIGTVSGLSAIIVALLFILIE